MQFIESVILPQLMHILHLLSQRDHTALLLPRCDAPPRLEMQCHSLAEPPPAPHGWMTPSLILSPQSTTVANLNTPPALIRTGEADSLIETHFLSNGWDSAQGGLFTVERCMVYGTARCGGSHMLSALASASAPLRLKFGSHMESCADGSGSAEPRALWCNLQSMPTEQGWYGGALPEKVSLSGENLGWFPALP